MKVRNLNGTTQNTCKCGSWLEHWKNFSQQALPTYCPVAGCIEKPVVGAHVQKEDLNDKRWYIIPLCKTCNAQTGAVLTTSEIKLAPANVSETCAK